MKGTLASAASQKNVFLSVLDQTPALLYACTIPDKPAHVRNARTHTTSQLKTLRLVSQGARAAASRAVTMFVLVLNREPGRDMSGIVQLLSGACLQHFRVRVDDTVLQQFPNSGEQAAVREGEEVGCASIASS